MIIFLLSVLICSTLGMGLLLYAKHWELSTGQMLLGTTRPHLSSFFHRALAFFEERLPVLFSKWVGQIKEWLRYGARTALAHALLGLEKWLERTLHGVRNATPQPQGEASTFLQEVADHKKRLARFRSKRNKVE